MIKQELKEKIKFDVKSLEDEKLLRKCLFTISVLAETNLDCQIIRSYDYEIAETKRIIAEDKRFKNLTDFEKIDVIFELINRNRIKNNVLDLLEKVPHFMDSYIFNWELPSLYYDLLDDLGVEVMVRNYDFEDPFTSIFRFEEISKDKQDKILDQYVRRRRIK